jgi:hypothetical protein
MLDGGHMWLRTKGYPHWYVYELRGQSFIVWVSEIDRASAMTFRGGDEEEWRSLLSEASGIELECKKPF